MVLFLGVFGGICPLFHIQKFLYRTKGLKVDLLGELNELWKGGSLCRHPVPRQKA